MLIWESGVYKIETIFADINKQSPIVRLNFKRLQWMCVQDTQGKTVAIAYMLRTRSQMSPFLPETSQNDVIGVVEKQIDCSKSFTFMDLTASGS